MKYDEYGEPVTGSHKTRLAKVTLYLEVPSISDQFGYDNTWYSEDEICQMIENNVCQNGIITTSYSDIIISDIEGDSPDKFKNPVGWLAPDGKFFLIESEEEGLAHLSLSRRVYDLYKNDLKRVYGRNTENTLERAGFIKVHCSEIRYFSNLFYQGYYDQGECRTPLINQTQRESLNEYFETHPEYKQYLSINGHRYNINWKKFSQSDHIQFNKLFEL